MLHSHLTEVVSQKPQDVSNMSYDANMSFLSNIPDVLFKVLPH